VRVQLTDAELATLQVRAAAENLTVSHYLVRAALDAPDLSNRAVALELSGARWTVAQVGSDLRRIAEHAQDGRYDAAVHDKATGRVAAVMEVLHTVLARYATGGTLRS
jgi:hypothetical protein